MAALEAFGPRVRYTGTGRLATGTRQVTSAGDAAHVVAQLRKEPQESLLAIVTDDAGDVLRVVRHTVGTRDASQVDPGLMAAAAHSTPGGRRVWFVHQHPSGDATQSAADARITERLHELLRDTGVTPEGMVVVGQVANGYGTTDLRVGQEVELVVEPEHASEQLIYRWKPVVELGEEADQ